MLAILAVEHKVVWIFSARRFEHKVIDFRRHFDFAAFVVFRSALFQVPHTAGHLWTEYLRAQHRAR
jgi:hypothetical protein